MNTTGHFSFALGGLTPDTTYYFRAKAVGDGTSFGAERNVTTSGASYPVATATGTGTATFSSDLGNITDLTAVAEGTLPTAGKPDGVTFPHGLFSFNITGITVGSTVTVTITLPSAIPAAAQYWKYQNGQWIDCTSLLGDDDDDNVLTLTITDGGLGDADGVANGTIIDPGGPAVVGVVPPPPPPAPPTPSARRVSPSPPQPQLPPADVRLRSISVSPSQTQTGQPVTILANMVNSGASSGSYNVALRINGRVEQQRTIEVSPGAAYPVKFIVTKSQPGTYTVNIGDQKSSFIVTGAGSRLGEGMDEGLLLAVAIAAIAILLGLLVVIARRRIQGY